MPKCPRCQNESNSLRAGQLCPPCTAEVLASDVYTPQDLRFTGVLAGVLTAAFFSMPGAFVGHFVGQYFENESRGTTIGTLMCSIIGLLVGYRLGIATIQRMESAKRASLTNTR